MIEYTFTDTMGPEQILHVYDPITKMKGIVVVDTTVGSTAGGGTRMMPDITTGEIFGLARAMTYKFAIFGLPIGGAKAGIMADPGLQGSERQELLQAFGRGVKPLLSNGISLAADIGTDGEDVEAFYKGADLPSPSKGLSFELLDGEPMENHATGYGVVQAAKTACEVAKLDISSATVAIEGFGKVGGGVARYMNELGARVVAVSTLNGTIFNPDGLDVQKLLELRKDVGDDIINCYGDAEILDKKKIFELPVDILIPGARPYVINGTNAGSIQARVISSSANIPTTPEAEKILLERGIIEVPDFISNAGGIIVALVDFLGGTTKDVFNALQRLIPSLTTDILTGSLKTGAIPRHFAIDRAEKTVLQTRLSGSTDEFDDLIKKVKENFGLSESQ